MRAYIFLRNPAQIFTCNNETNTKIYVLSLSENGTGCDLLVVTFVIKSNQIQIRTSLFPGSLEDCHKKKLAKRPLIGILGPLASVAADRQSILHQCCHQHYRITQNKIHNNEYKSLTGIIGGKEYEIVLRKQLIITDINLCNQ